MCFYLEKEHWEGSLLVGNGRENLWGKGMISCLTEALKDGGLEQVIKKAGIVSLLAKRLLQMAAGWVAGLTICSPFFFGCITCWGGMCLSGALAFLTLEKGVWGLPVFLWLLFPPGGDLWDYLGSSCRLGRRTGNAVFIWPLFFFCFFLPQPEHC